MICESRASWPAVGARWDVAGLYAKAQRANVGKRRLFERCVEELS